MLKTIKSKLSHSDVLQGILEKQIYPTGETAYIKTKSGKESWFDRDGHLIHRKTSIDEEFRDYDNNGVLRRLHKIGKYEVLYNEKGLREHKIKTNGIEEFWEYNESDHLCKWYNTSGHERQYICDDSGKVITWRGNQLLIDWYAKTGRNFDKNFDGIIIVNI